jgi:hypothetical protein
MESILLSIKKLLGLDESYEAFDEDIKIYINSVLATLPQLGVGPSSGFSIDGRQQTWDELLDNDARLNFVRSYVYLKVRLLFDPPTSSYAIDAINKQISELEWRIVVTVDGSAT